VLWMLVVRPRYQGRCNEEADTRLRPRRTAALRKVFSRGPKVPLVPGLFLLIPATRLVFAAAGTFARPSARH
jgi:hypothetical protein